MTSVEIQLFGRFEVMVDGRPVPAAAWRHRRAAGLVKLLALTSGNRLHREQVIEAIGRICQRRPEIGTCTRRPTSPERRSAIPRPSRFLVRRLGSATSSGWMSSGSKARLRGHWGELPLERACRRPR